MKSLKDQILTRCVHFTGIQHDTCDAGVNYDTVRESQSTGPHRWPCFSDSGAVWSCPKASFLTPEQAAEEAEKITRESAEVLAAHLRGEETPGTFVHVCTAENFHPYECGGTDEGCIHCKGEKTEHHDPEGCAMCKGYDEEPPL